ncbi:hypothetical protein BOTNAR_0001g00610 [Botryotinia narcissicola]|uniref:Uncharacterized protein n=1 Tax=Botryotinia narcissicola TaxID=278944 RepID=A0A4Z1J9I3_9HELO|nr:hypothetical protein BOTNAR_0001g00610 [Botryotinia narcissicola]
MAPLLGTVYEPSLICMESLVIVHDDLNCLAYETYHSTNARPEYFARSKDRRGKSIIQQQGSNSPLQIE